MFSDKLSLIIINILYIEILNSKKMVYNNIILFINFTIIFIWNMNLWLKV